MSRQLNLSLSDSDYATLKSVADKKFIRISTLGRAIVLKWIKQLVKKKESNAAKD